ncbi:hypothetical protein [Halalkalicoccus jeotgali]|uniref:Uncharacterized protein n=1 Tax=Halalkalicoccus jeotgali (strain DSM 18796 / CECT 7217 / JCM 14584 / KCTC 4019 / B3) TaxID=795797 RepID=D8JA43_HALJB|nr:hypothetical protein [Halalkalicoccus jeotgali]ADJ14565.1 hypothetical protein HacjB3_05870 [Halalkalicoccus jeotgali B3]ELY39937.1 hypothetical protein C497_04242 [Halalkalicoccus jeotgali B3]
MPTYALTPIEDLGIEIDRDDPEITILVGEPDMESFVEGGGDTTYVCGDCGATILKDVERGAIGNLGFECIGCGTVLYLPAHDD